MSKGNIKREILVKKIKVEKLVINSNFLEFMSHLFLTCMYR